METEGAASLAEALKVNTTLQSIRCISKAQELAFAHKRQGPLTLLFPHCPLTLVLPSTVCSIDNNQICGLYQNVHGDLQGTYTAEGINSIAEMLKVNTTLCSIR